MQINTCIKPVCRTPSAQISSFYESRFESLENDRLMPPHFEEEETKFVNQFEIDFFGNPDAFLLEQTLYEDVLIRKKSIESMNSLVPREEEENWGVFGCDNSFEVAVANPEDENKRDKEILPDIEMME